MEVIQTHDGRDDDDDDDDAATTTSEKKSIIFLETDEVLHIPHVLKFSFNRLGI